MEGIAAPMPPLRAPASVPAGSSPPTGGAGQTQDFSRIFAENLGWAWSLVRRLGVADRDVEDVTHDAFVAVHRHLDRYDRARPLRPGLYAFVVHAALAQKRRAHVRNERLAASDEGEVEGACDAPSPESQSAQKQAIAAALGSRSSTGMSSPISNAASATATCSGDCATAAVPAKTHATGARSQIGLVNARAAPDAVEIGDQIIDLRPV